MKLLKTYIKILILLAIFVFSFSIYLINAYLLDTSEIGMSTQVGFVKVDYHIYFDDGTSRLNASEVYIGTFNGVDYYKTGVYAVNISDPDAINYIENLRIDFYVSSNVDTYFRVILEEQLAMTRVDEQNITTEYSYITESSQLNFDLDAWSYHPLHNKNYWYYKSPIKQTGEDPTLVPWLLPYFFDQNYVPKSSSYSIQMGIRIDAVQAILGPENNWRLPSKPWGGDWS